MPDKIGGSSSSPPPQIPQDTTVENAKQTDTTAPASSSSSSTPGQTASSTQTPQDKEKLKTGRFQELGLSGIAQAAMIGLQSIGMKAPSTLPTDELLKRNDNQKEPKQEVMDLQKEVNQWRAENGKPPIKEDGFYGGKTEAAVKEFQKANHLQADGQAGIQTQNHVLLENDSDFKKLDPGIKDQTRQLMSEYGKDSAKIQTLRDFATTPGLSKLSTGHQQQMLDLQKAHADDPKFTSQLQTLANDGTFRSLNDATKTDVLNRVGGYAGDPGKIDNLTKLATSSGFEKLSNDEQKHMLDKLGKTPDDAQLAAGLGKLAGDKGFQESSNAVKKSVVDTLGDNPPLTDQKLNSTTGLIGSPGFKGLTDADKALVTDGLKGAKANPAYADNVKTLVNDPKFAALKPEEKTALLSQVKNYPDARSVANLDRMISKDWFGAQNFADKQRSMKTVAYLSQYDAGDRKVINNTLGKMLDPKSDFKLVWKDYVSNGKSIYYGEGDDKTLWLNRGMLPADNNKVIENGQTKELIVATSAHEVNHLLNSDKVQNTFRYFEAEYRAWYVGFEAKNGRPPTNQEAVEQRIRWQLNKDGPYGKPAEEALKDPKEAQKFFDLWSKMTGQKVDASNYKTILNSDASKWKTATDQAPIPNGNVDNH
jgi:peptidoglycan hydrolase-like protein with peptidoglycan-binding domain